MLLISCEIESLNAHTDVAPPCPSQISVVTPPKPQAEIKDLEKSLSEIANVILLPHAQDITDNLFIPNIPVGTWTYSDRTILHDDNKAQQQQCAEMYNKHF